MKVALVLSGLARKVEEGYGSYWSDIISKHDTDVYLHYWVGDESDKVLRVFKPKKYLEMQPFKFSQYAEGIYAPDDDKSRPIEAYGIAGNFRIFPMLYGWQTGFNLIEGEYDCVIRSRYDIGWHESLDLNAIDMSKINIAAMHWPNSPIMDDNLCITSQDLATKLFSDIFDEFVQHSRESKIIYFQEKNFTNILLRKGLYDKVCKSWNMNFKLLRENIVWY